MPEPRTLEEQQAVMIADHGRRLRKLESLECPADDDSGLIPWGGVRCPDIIPRLGDFGICNGQFEQGTTTGYPIACNWIEESVDGAATRVAGGAAGDWCISLVTGAGTAALRYDRYLCVYENRDYYIACHAMSVGGTETLQIGAHCYDAAGAFIATVWAYNAAVPAAWTAIPRRIGPTGHVAWPANTRYCRLLMHAPTKAETLYVDDMQFQQLRLAWPIAHDILSAEHGDTLPAAVSRGSVIFGNGTPNWAELVIGANQRYVGSDGADVAWRQVDHTHLSGVAADQHHNEVHNVLSASHGDALAAAVVRGDVIIGDATPDWSRLGVGAANEVLGTDGIDVAWVPPPSPAYVCVRDVKASGTNGGNFVAGAWRTRVINNEQADPAGICAIAGNQITLAAGTYTCAISCPAFRVYRHQSRLQNITDAATILLGSSEGVASHVDANDSNRSFIAGRFILAAPKVLEIQHRCTTTRNLDGFGCAAVFGNNEIYTIATFTRG